MLACTKEDMQAPPLSNVLSFSIQILHSLRTFIPSRQVLHHVPQLQKDVNTDQEAHYYNPSNKYITALRPFTAKTESL